MCLFAQGDGSFVQTIPFCEKRHTPVPCLFSGNGGDLKMKVRLIGMGCGPDTWTAAAARYVMNADLCIGAKRLLDALPDGYTALKTAEYRPSAIIEILKQHNPSHACILLSGDSGFYSGAAGLVPVLRDNGIETEIIPGISSIQYFAAKLQRPWQDWRIASAHGIVCDPVFEVMQGKPAFFLTSGAEGPGTLCRPLAEAGLGSLEVFIGEDLGTDKEKITCITAAEVPDCTFSGLNVMLVSPAPRLTPHTPGIPDEEFIRGKVPMTKQEIRAVILSKLSVSKDDVCWDIGAGTGSVSVELALCGRSVWAVEQNPEAFDLISQNRRKFCAWNLNPVYGTAPAALGGLPKPNAVFVGGSGGHLGEILHAVHDANPEARICVSAIAIETLSSAVKYLSELGYHPEIMQISVSRAKEAGKLHMMLSQNPVFLISGSNGGSLTSEEL